MLHTSNSDARAQLTEAFPRQSLGCDVRQLLLCPDELNLHPAILDALSNKMVPDVDVFAAVVEHMILAERDGGLVVNLQAGGTGLSASEF